MRGPHWRVTSYVLEAHFVNDLCWRLGARNIEGFLGTSCIGRDFKIYLG